MGEDSLDSIGQRIEAEGWNAAYAPLELAHYSTQILRKLLSVRCVVSSFDFRTFTMPVSGGQMLSGAVSIANP